MLGKRIAALALPLLTVASHAPAAAGAGRPRVSAADTVRTDSVAHPVRDGVILGEAVVSAGRGTERQMRSALNTVGVARQYIEDNFSGSLMQTLERLPGVKAMSVGSGASKPVIRGLGFNRVVVAENGIKHEGQQWGDDHGLETDQFAVERAEVIKGPAALTYGSDAIGGVIDLRTDAVPDRRFAGGVNLFGRSNNASVGTALRLEGRRGSFWYKATATLIDYGDYRVPADSIQYYSYYIKLKDRCLRNTAGRELDGSLTLGYGRGRLKGHVRLSAVGTRSGFFADAHGLEVRLSDIDYDRSRRDIDLPSHTVGHLMAASHTEWQWHGGTLTADLAYQDNRQRERSEPVSHGYMPLPPGTLERSFDKQTVTASLGAHLPLGQHAVQAGASAEWQDNRRGGWGFILPAFSQLTAGAYVADRYVVSEGFIVSAGVRFDYGTVRIHSYRDWFKTPVAAGDSVYVERSADMRRHFGSLTWSVGINRRFGDLVVKANAGKSFRMPIAKELGVDGINYNIFRYEKGNAALSPEKSYQLDAGLAYARGPFSAGLTPYANYFPNYIYLNPTATYREGLQLYNYTQSRVFRWGFEATAAVRLTHRLALSAEGEYLHARQLSGEKKGYTLPFSTPWSLRLEARYSLPTGDAALSDGGFVSVEWCVTGAQREVVPPEEPTPGYQLLNAAASKQLALAGHALRLTLRCDNLLGRRYYDHTSYYRLIGVPEPGRNFSLMASWQF